MASAREVSQRPVGEEVRRLERITTASASRGLRLWSSAVFASTSPVDGNDYCTTLIVTVGDVTTA